MTQDTVIGLLLGFIFSVVANFVFEVTGLKTYAAVGNERRATRRIAQLEQRLATLGKFHGDSSALNGYMASRALALLTLWALQSALDAFWGLFFTGQGAYQTFTAQPKVIKSSEEMLKIVNDQRSTAEWVSAFDFGISVLFVVMLFITFTIGYKAWRTWRGVQDYEAQEKILRASIERLEASIRPAGKPPEAGH